MRRMIKYSVKRDQLHVLKVYLAKFIGWTIHGEGEEGQLIFTNVEQGEKFGKFIAGVGMPLSVVDDAMDFVPDAPANEEKKEEVKEEVKKEEPVTEKPIEKVEKAKKAPKATKPKVKEEDKKEEK